MKRITVTLTQDQHLVLLEGIRSDIEVANNLLDNKGWVDNQLWLEKTYPDKEQYIGKIKKIRDRRNFNIRLLQDLSK